jgi:predicted Zn-dependent protease
LDKKTEALNSAHQAVDLDNAFLPAYMDLADWLISGKALDAAIVILQQGLALLPQNNDLRSKLSRVYLEAGKTQEAIAEARLVVNQRGWSEDLLHLTACLSALEVTSE